ncbi:helix-turn-helix domain-containing protein [Nonomuraea sp. NPDC049695]|uniref:TetR/AcrR family transcriptional regulator n=1 Tax=Nonomuraea sp. NPDC049695 TaxID=3154734 RepID=UPI0034362C8C
MTGRERGLRADAARNYERIVGAAVATFEDIGPEATLEEIAERAEVSVMTLYRRFRNRDQLIRAVFDHVLATEIEPMTTVHTDDPWRDLVGALETAIEVLVRRRAIHSLALEFRAFAAETGQRFLGSLEPLLRRAIDANMVRQELELRDVVAVIIMTMATVHSEDLAGAGRRRYFALLAEGLRPSAITLPPLPPAEPEGATRACARRRGRS